MLKSLTLKYRLLTAAAAALTLTRASGTLESPPISLELSETAAAYEGYQILQDQIGIEQTCIIAKMIEDSSYPELIRGLITVESEWQVDALSPYHAIGLMQIRELAAVEFEPDITEETLFNPMRNVELGIAIFEKYMDYFRDYSEPEHWALTSYNRGLSGANALEMNPPRTAFSCRVILNMEMFEG